MGYLLLGDLKNGFQNYEDRLVTSENQKPNMGLPAEMKWKLGESIAGKRLLIHGEQGLGDAIMGLRFLPMVRELGPSEILVVEHSAIHPLIAHENLTVCQRGEDITGKFDVWVALMSLPLYLGIEREDQIPGPYQIKCDAGLVKQWNSIVNPLWGVTVGICWAGNFSHKNDAHRSIPLKQFARLFDAPVNFVSVQQMRPAETDEFAELQQRHKNLAAVYLNDFRDTAAVIRQCNLVVTADTAVAHLAGTLGVPTWIFIPKFSTDWRWQLERTDSPWYPSVSLYRQTKIGDWNTVLDRVAHDLSALPGT